jgi:hypothetical protein
MTISECPVLPNPAALHFVVYSLSQSQRSKMPWEVLQRFGAHLLIPCRAIRDSLKVVNQPHLAHYFSNKRLNFAQQLDLYCRCTMALISFDRHSRSKMESALLTRKASRTRASPRSRSIQICSNRPKPSESQSEECEESYALKVHYNSATIQMYNRIIDYRVRNPLTYDDDASAKHSANDSTCSESLDSASSSQVMDSDAIFEMDL